MHDLEERDKICKEDRAFRSTRFTREEVEQFRELFRGAIRNCDEEGEGEAQADGTKEVNRADLSLSEFKEMIGQICPLEKSHAVQLSMVLRETLGLNDEGS